MRARERRVSVRASVLQRQVLTPLPSTDVQPVPPQCGHGASCISVDPDIMFPANCLRLYSRGVLDFDAAHLYQRREVKSITKPSSLTTFFEKLFSTIQLVKLAHWSEGKF